MYLQIPYIIEGEIVSVNDSKSPDAASMSPMPGQGTKLKRRPIVTYVCRATMADGAEIVLPNVVDMSMFGGIGDSMQIRRRASTDAFSTVGSSLGTYKVEPDATKMQAHIGDRVYISFINGSPLRPVIIGGIQHPLQTDRFEGITADDKPQMFLKYLGMSMVVDDKGQMSLTHYGAPEVKYTGGTDLMGALGGAASAALGALGGAFGDSYKGYSEGSVTWDEADNPAIKPRDFKTKTIWEFLDDGKWRVRDSLGQMFELDPKKSQILLTDNGVSSTMEATEEAAFDDNSADFLLLDRKEERACLSARKILNIYSYDLRADTTEGDHTHDVTGGETITIGGDKTDTIDGTVTRTIKTDLIEDVSGSATWTIGGTFDKTVTGAATLTFSDALTMSITSDWTMDTQGNWALTVQGDMTAMDGTGAGLKVSGGKVEIGASAAGLFDTVSQIMQQLDAMLTAITSMTVPTANGPSGVPINSAQFVNVQSQIATLKSALDSVKGSL